MPPELHSYQRVAVDFLRRKKRAGLFLDMGLGKTCVTLSALSQDRLPVLVVAPKRVAEEVWGPERDLWRPDLSIRVAAGTPKARAAALRSDADIVVIGRDNLADAEPVASRFKTLVIDELSGFKSRKSNRWHSARRIITSIQRAHGQAFVWGLTGTPSPNGLIDLWSQVYLLDGGKRLDTSITRFRSRYFTPGRQLRSGVVTEWIPYPETPTRIHELLEDLCLSMETDGRIDLPPVTHNVVKVPLLPKVRQQYKKMKKDLVLDLETVGGEVHTASSAAVLSSKLSQISAGFLYVDDADLRDGAYTLLHNEKTNAVREIIDGTGSPVLVFYRFKAEREMLRKAIPQARVATEPGIIKAWNAGQVPVMLAHPASAGHGLNLQHGGHTIVWTTLPWSLEEWDQANKRLARQGQKHPVIIHSLVSPATVDVAIRQALSDKKSVQQALLDHLESPL